MEFKPNWADTKERFCEYWRAENHDRALIAVTAPNRFFNADYYHTHLDIERFDDNDTESIMHWWRDVDENLKRNEYLFKTTWFGGEALPIAFTNWGAMAMCSFYGCTPTFNKRSVWYNKIITDWDTWQWCFDENNHWYQTTLELTQAFAQAGKGRYFAGMPELGCAADLLSLMRGMEDLCMDTFEEPEALDSAIKFLTDEFLRIQEKLMPIISPTGDGGSTLPWMSLWMPGRNGNQLASDFSTVISDEDFRRFFFDEFKREATWSDYATYHLDGPACMRNHLDSLLEIPEIKAIEYTPGIGSPLASYEPYFARYDKILSAGKRLVLIAEPQEIDILTKRLPPEGVFIKTTAENQEDGEKLLSIAEKNATEFWR